MALDYFTAFAKKALAAGSGGMSSFRTSAHFFGRCEGGRVGGRALALIPLLCELSFLISSRIRACVRAGGDVTGGEVQAISPDVMQCPRGGFIVPETLVLAGLGFQVI